MPPQTFLTPPFLGICNEQCISNEEWIPQQPVIFPEHFKSGRHAEASQTGGRMPGAASALTSYAKASVKHN